MLKVVRRMRCGFEMQTSGPRDDVTGRRKAQAEDKYIAHQKAAALELKPGVESCKSLAEIWFLCVVDF